jgi:hypothetical protein
MACPARARPAVVRLVAAQPVVARSAVAPPQRLACVDLPATWARRRCFVRHRLRKTTASAGRPWLPLNMRQLRRLFQLLLMS